MNSRLTLGNNFVVTIISPWWLSMNSTEFIIVLDMIVSSFIVVPISLQFNCSDLFQRKLSWNDNSNSLSLSFLNLNYYHFLSHEIIFWVTSWIIVFVHIPRKLFFFIWIEQKKMITKFIYSCVQSESLVSEFIIIMMDFYYFASSEIKLWAFWWWHFH